MTKVHGENYINDGAECEWCRKFKAGRFDVHPEGGQKHKSIAKEEPVE